MDDVTISAKNLGGLSLPDFCERCFWIKLKAKLPWQIFPGIFSSIDSYTKAVTNVSHAANGSLPKWLEDRWPGAAPEKVPHYTKFSTTDPATGVTLRGGPDEMLRLQKGGLAILDYKTSKITKNQDALAPLYATQLNAYGYIAEALGEGPVKEVALVYCEPRTKLEETEQISRIGADGFNMPFSIAIKDVELNLDGIPPLLEKVAKIAALEEAPDRNEDCKDCEKLADLLEKLNPAKV